LSHLLVIANETAATRALLEEVKRHVTADDLVTVLAPINVPSSGYVVYEDTRRASAGRRLHRTLAGLREAGIVADGHVIDAGPVDATRDALAQLDPPPDRIIVSTHPREKSGWLRKHVVERIQDVAGETPVEHVVVDVAAEARETNVLVIANETVVGEPLLEKIRERAGRSPASFLIICPQSDPTQSHHPEAERRLRRALAVLRGHGIDAHGQIAHPDPFTAAMHAIEDERIDEIIVSTFPSMRSGWMRRHLVERLEKDTGRPVEHVVVEPEAVGAAP
jgi:hypothetical protein